MDGLFSATIDMFQSRPGLPGPSNRGLSRLSARRLGRRHAGLVPARARPPATDRLFFAVLPDAETAAQIAENAARWRADHGLRGKPLKAEHLHVTLCHVGDYYVPPTPELMGELAERAATVVMPAFRAEFDHVVSFKNGAFVLTGDESTIGLEILQQRLSDALDPTPRPARRFTPHLTLLRDGRHIAEQAVERIGWTAREVVLVHSLLGQTTHRHVARIPLS